MIIGVYVDMGADVDVNMDMGVNMDMDMNMNMNIDTVSTWTLLAFCEIKKVYNP
jgi:hypothetical protein